MSRRVVASGSSERYLAAAAHRDAHPEPKKVTLMTGRPKTTEYRWRSEGPPQLTLYALNAPDKWRICAHMRSLAYRETVEKMLREDVIQRYSEVRIALAERHAELEKARFQGAPRVDRSVTCERVAALYEELAALEKRMSALRITDAEVRE